MKRFSFTMATILGAVLTLAVCMPMAAPAEAAVFTQSAVDLLIQDPAPAAEIRMAPAEATAMPADAKLILILFLFGLPVFGTTLAANKPRAYELGHGNQIPVIAADIIYEGAAVGIVAGTGHARPLAAGDRFAGFAERKADNSAGAAAAINVDVIKSGEMQLSVTGALITDVGQPVYATDDDTFVFLPVAAVFIGFVKRFVSSGVVIVDFNAGVYQDPYGDRSVRELLSGVKTFDAQDTGKVFFVDADGDGDALTLPAIADGLGGIKIVAIGGFGTTLVKIDPAAADMILGPDISGADNKDLLLTKATQRRGDYVVLDLGDADGYVVTEMVGTWAREA